MKIDFDEETDSAYLSLDESKIVDSEEVLCDVVFDYDEHDQVVGVEVLRFSKTFPALFELDIPFRSNYDRQVFTNFLIERNFAEAVNLRNIKLANEVANNFQNILGATKDFLEEPARRIIPEN
jgi:uncharacterized protein YuzE